MKLTVLLKASQTAGRIFALVSILILSTNISLAQSPFEVCASPDRATSRGAMLRVFQYHEEAIVEMGRMRGVPLPMFDQDDPTPIVEHIARYVAARDKSAFMIFAADQNHICSYLFTRNSRRPAYRRHSISVSGIQHANGELRRAILCNHMGSTRAPRLKRDGSLVPWFVTAGDAATNCESFADSAASVRLLSQIFFPAEFRHLLEPIRHLAILPIRSLSAVPIAVLEPFGDGRQTVELFSTNFVAFFPDIRNTPSQPGADFSNPLIIGDPDGSTDEEYSFVPLPGALREAEELHSAFGGRLLRRSEARATTFVEAAGSADLIYIAAHGLSDFENSMDKSFIRMADTRMTARQVQELRLERHPLVVLSACQTGLGTVVEAGIIGIGRAFQKAGARNTVMSLWNVFDDPTYYMMTEFRKQILSNTPAEALRLAMLAGKQKYPEPVNWSGFMVLGN